MEVKVITNIDELQINTIYGIDKDNIKSMYILKGIVNKKYLFDKVIIIQNNNEDKYLAIKDNRGLNNYMELCDCELEKIIENKEISELLKLQSSCTCNCTNCNCK